MVFCVYFALKWLKFSHFVFACFNLTMSGGQMHLAKYLKNVIL